MEVALQVATILASLATIGTTILAVFALRQAKQIFKEQLKFNRRQLFLSIFEQFEDMATIDCEKNEDEEIVKMINFLELLGICYEGQIVDKDMLFRVFGDLVIEQYRALESCTERLENHKKSGRDMLLECRSAAHLYKILIDEDNKRNLPSKITKE